MERLLDIAARRLQDRPGRAAPPQPDPARQAAPSHRDRASPTTAAISPAISRACWRSADWDGFPARRAEARKRGRLLGIGVANYVETPVGMPHERVAVEVSPDGASISSSERSRAGRGTRPASAQVMADQLGVDARGDQFRRRRQRHAGVGRRHAFRSLHAARRLADGRDLAHGRSARRAGSPPTCSTSPRADIAFADGLFVAPNSNRRLTLFDIARAIADRSDAAGRSARAARAPRRPSPAASRPIRPAPRCARPRSIRRPARSSSRRYTSIDDGGQAINPLILHGQVHGGVAQGMGQAMMEAMVYEPGSGQMLSASFLDYGMPRADHFPSLGGRPHRGPDQRATRCASRAAARPASRRARRC